MKRTAIESGTKKAVVGLALELSIVSPEFEGLLLRLAFLERANRSRTIFHQCPPSRVWGFSERIAFYPKNAERTGSGTTAYAWFV